MESALRPREIQARIRSGESLEEVARAAGVPAERIEAYAGPVLAERNHVAGLALASSVRRSGETVAHRSLRVAAEQYLSPHGVDIDSVEWDAWRTGDRRWRVVARYERAGQSCVAEFLFDLPGRFSVADNDDSRALIGDDAAGQEDSDELALVRAVSDPEPVEPVTPAPGDPGSGLRLVSEQPTDSVRALSDDPAESSKAHALGPDEVSPAPAAADRFADATTFWPSAPASPQEIGHEVEAELDTYDVIPEGRSELDVLYDMLGGLSEDSINIYAGLQDGPPADLGSMASEHRPAAVAEPAIPANADMPEVPGDRGSTGNAPAPETAGDSSVGGESRADLPVPGDDNDNLPAPTSDSNNLPVPTNDTDNLPAPTNDTDNLPAPTNDTDKVPVLMPGGQTPTSGHSDGVIGQDTAGAAAETPEDASTPAMPGPPLVPGDPTPVGEIPGDAAFVDSEPATTQQAPEPTAAAAGSAPAAATEEPEATVGLDHEELREAGLTADASPTPRRRTGPQRPAEQPSLVEGEGPVKAPRRRKKRASVPSWDEIMFGGPPTKPSGQDH